MGSAKESFSEGSLAGSLKAVQRYISSGPHDGKLQVFFAQLLMLTGQWDRALDQLNSLGPVDAGMLVLAHTYRGLIEGERVRSAVFAGQCPPAVIGGMKPWLAHLSLHRPLASKKDSS